MTAVIEQKDYREETVENYLTVEPKLVVTVAMNQVRWCHIPRVKPKECNDRLDVGAERGQSANNLTQKLFSRGKRYRKNIFLCESHSDPYKIHSFTTQMLHKNSYVL